MQIRELRSAHLSVRGRDRVQRARMNGRSSSRSVAARRVNHGLRRRSGRVRVGRLPHGAERVDRVRAGRNQDGAHSNAADERDECDAVRGAAFHARLHGVERERRNAEQRNEQRVGEEREQPRRRGQRCKRMDMRNTRLRRSGKHDGVLGRGGGRVTRIGRRAAQHGLAVRRGRRGRGRGRFVCDLVDGRKR